MNKKELTKFLKNLPTNWIYKIVPNDFNDELGIEGSTIFLYYKNCKKPAYVNFINGGDYCFKYWFINQHYHFKVKQSFFNLKEMHDLMVKFNKIIKDKNLKIECDNDLFELFLYEELKEDLKIEDEDELRDEESNLIEVPVIYIPYNYKTKKINMNELNYQIKEAKQLFKQNQKYYDHIMQKFHKEGE